MKIHTDIPDELLAKVDEYIESPFTPVVNRSQAIRLFVLRGLQIEARPPVSGTCNCPNASATTEVSA